MSPLRSEPIGPILKNVPNSVLWLLEYPSDAKENLKREAAENGVDPERIIITPKAKRDRAVRIPAANVLLLAYMSLGQILTIK